MTFVTLLAQTRHSSFVSLDSGVAADPLGARTAAGRGGGA
jgi:hypothetical protein